MKRLWIVIAGLLFTLPVLAKDINVKLYLAGIKAVQMQEMSGDELYFDIAEYSKRGLQQFYRVPEGPVHLLSKHLEKIKDLKLWQGKLAEGEGVQLIISLLEEDSPPWDLDDLIGIVKINLQNKGGKLQSSFNLPNNKAEPEKIKHANEVLEKLSLSGANASYDIDLLLKT